MGRSTQFIGHTNRVIDFLSTCERVEKIGEVTGMFDEPVADLHRYRDADGNLWDEVVEFEPWSSGPVIFLGIRCGDRWMGWEPVSASHEFVDYESGEFYM